MACEDSLKMTIYRVSGKTLPWSDDMEQTVGYYREEETAKKVVAMVREINQKEVPGGVDVVYRKCVVEVIRGPSGFHLKEGPLELVIETLNRSELMRIAEMKFKWGMEAVKLEL